MTPREYEERLDEFSPKELQEFNDAFGGGRKSVQDRVKEFVRDPQHERSLRHLLGLQTEDEKLTEAALRSASAADPSARSAKWSAIWSGVACLIAVTATIAAFSG